MNEKKTIGELIKALPEGAKVEISVTVPREDGPYGRRLGLGPEDAENAEDLLRKLLAAGASR